MSVATVLGGGALAWVAAARISDTGALQDPETIVVQSELVAAMPRAVRESSGLAISETYPVSWTHNDSGDGPVLYAVDTTGAIVGRARLAGVRARDFEDLDKGPCPPRWSSEPYCLYVADTGNNDRDRNTVSIYILPEPVPHEPMVTAEVARLRFRYPDQRSDVEALAVAPNGDLYLVSKGRRGGVRSYRIVADEVARALDSEERAVVENTGLLPLEPDTRSRRLVTGATYVAPSLLVVRTYEGIYGFKMIEAGWTRTGGCTIRPREPGGEAIAHEGGDRFLLTSEAASTRYPSMHRVECPLGR